MSLQMNQFYQAFPTIVLQVKNAGVRRPGYEANEMVEGPHNDTNFSSLHFLGPLPEGHVGIGRGAPISSFMLHCWDQRTPLKKGGRTNRLYSVKSQPITECHIRLNRMWSAHQPKSLGKPVVIHSQYQIVIVLEEQLGFSL